MAALKRLLLISLISIIAVFLTLLSLRMIGFQSSYQSSFSHALYELRPWVLTPATLEQLKNPVEGAILALDLNHDVDGLWSVQFDEASEPLPLKNLLEEFKPQQLYIHILSHQTYYLKELGELLTSAGLNERVLVQSDFPAVLHELRKLQPFWLFGTDLNSKLRFQLFESLYIETLMPARGDFVLIGLKDDISPRVIEELRRRKKDLILAEGEIKVEELKEQNWSGFLTTRPSLLLEFLRRATE